MRIYFTAALLAVSLFGCEGNSTQAINNSAIADDDQQNLIAPGIDFTRAAIDAGYISLPANIEAEAFSAQRGVSIGQTDDSGGSDYLGWINDGNFSKYNIDVPEDGTYTIEVRVASKNQTSELQFSSDGKSSTVTVTPTGSWGTWKTVSTTLQLSEGDQVLRLGFSGDSDSYLMNLNWLSIDYADTDNLNSSDWIVSSNANTDDAYLAIDGNSNTRWTTETKQTSGQHFYVDLGSRQEFDRIILDSTQSSDDYPRSYQVYVSDDNSNWTEVAAGTGTTNGSTVIDFADQDKEYIRISQGGTTTRNWWSIHELSIYADASDETSNTLNLNLRVHIMEGGSWIHETGQSMANWVTEDDVINTLIPEMNDIWSEAGIKWVAEQIIVEPIVEYNGFQDDIDHIIAYDRGDDSDDKKSGLYDLMVRGNKSADTELGTNLFHIYIFPFLGNESQGSAMEDHGWHSVVGSWSNKHNDGGVPERTLLTEDHSDFDRGSLGRTMAHEIGHVLDLSHSCEECLMDNEGYGLDDDQIDDAQDEAEDRIGS